MSECYALWTSDDVPGYWYCNCRQASGWKPTREEVREQYLLHVAEGAS